MDGKTDLAAGSSVEIGVRRQKAFRFRGRRLGKAIDIMMAVALGMGHADQGAQRQILLHGQSRLAGEILAGNEMLRAFRAPLRRARRIDDGFVDALAGFRGDAAIAERPRRREGIVGIISLVDDEVALGQRAERRLPGDIARHRLLDIEQL